MSEEAAVRQAVVPMNLLVVDDELHVRQLCADVAGDIGMHVTTVASAEEALNFRSRYSDHRFETTGIERTGPVAAVP
jgi:DNA-binding NtrC family response regulator